LIQDYVYSDLSGERDFAFYLGLSYPVGNNRDTTLLNGRLNQTGKINSDGGINSWFFSGALEVEKDIFVGATLNLISGSFNQTKIHTEEDSKNVYNSSFLLDPLDSETADFKSYSVTDRIAWDIAGWDLKLGMIAKINDQLNVGITIRLPRTFTIKETYSVTGNSIFGTGANWTEYFEDVKTEYDVKTPAEYSAGASYSEKNFTLAGEVKLIDFASMEFSSGFDGLSLNKKNNDIKELMRSVVNINAGGEYVLSSLGIALRGGFIYMPSAFKDDPTEYDKKYITAGIGYNLSKGMQLNVGYAYGWWEDYGDNFGSGISRTYQKITVSNITTSVKFNF
jgi:long-subunit fatty acid transport protein